MNIKAIPSMCFDQNLKEVRHGDTIRVYYTNENGQPDYDDCAVWYENGAFWVDDSLGKDKSSSTILAEYSGYEIMNR